MAVIAFLYHSTSVLMMFTFLFVQAMLYYALHCVTHKNTDGLSLKMIHMQIAGSALRLWLTPGRHETHDQVSFFSDCFDTTILVVGAFFLFYANSGTDSFPTVLLALPFLSLFGGTWMQEVLWNGSIYCDLLSSLPQIWLLLQMGEDVFKLPNAFWMYYIAGAMRRFLWYFGIEELGPNRPKLYLTQLLLASEFLMVVATVWMLIFKNRTAKKKMDSSVASDEAVSELSEYEYSDDGEAEISDPTQKKNNLIAVLADESQGVDCGENVECRDHPPIEPKKINLVATLPDESQVVEANNSDSSPKKGHPSKRKREKMKNDLEADYMMAVCWTNALVDSKPTLPAKDTLPAKGLDFVSLRASLQKQAENSCPANVGASIPDEYEVCINVLCRRKWKQLTPRLIPYFCPSCSRFLEMKLKPISDSKNHTEVEYLHAVHEFWHNFMHKLALKISTSWKSQQLSIDKSSPLQDMMSAFLDSFSCLKVEAVNCRNWNSMLVRRKYYRGIVSYKDDYNGLCRLHPEWELTEFFQDMKRPLNRFKSYQYFMIDWKDELHVNEKVNFIVFPNPVISNDKEFMLLMCKQLDAGSIANAMAKSKARKEKTAAAGENKRRCSVDLGIAGETHSQSPTRSQNSPKSQPKDRPQSPTQREYAELFPSVTVGKRTHCTVKATEEDPKCASDESVYVRLAAKARGETALRTEISSEKGPLNFVESVRAKNSRDQCTQEFRLPPGLSDQHDTILAEKTLDPCIQLQ